MISNAKSQFISILGKYNGKYRRGAKTFEFFDAGFNNPQAEDTSKAELAEGYKTASGKNLLEADRDEFILKPDGSKDFGKIDDKTAQIANENLQNNNSKAKMKAAPIRLQVGNGNFGYIHLNQRHLSQMQDKVFNNAIDFINHTLKNFNQIYDQSYAHKKSGKFINRFQKKWRELGGELGLNVVWIDANKDLKGAVEGGTIYLNAKI